MATALFLGMNKFHEDSLLTAISKSVVPASEGLRTLLELCGALESYSMESPETLGYFQLHTFLPISLDTYSFADSSLVVSFPLLS